MFLRKYYTNNFRLHVSNYITKTRRFTSDSSSKDLEKKQKVNVAPISGYDIYQKRLRFVKKCMVDGVNLYPNKFSISHSLDEVNNKYKYLSTDEKASETVTIGGRVSVKRGASKKLKFYDVIDNGTKLQIVAKFQAYCDENEFMDDNERIFRGDIIGIEGNPYRTNAGELSILAQKLTPLAPCLHVLPAPQNKLTNQNIIKRARYLDLLTNIPSRNRFITRTKIVSFLRKFLNDLNFLEVETPILNHVPGGAAAKPFTTRHNAQDLDLFLRVAPELYLKMLIIGGFNKVFEIGKQFRNEGIDTSHNPEFTSCEFYSAYSNYKDLIGMTEELLSTLVLDIFQSNNLTYEQSSKKISLNFKPPFKKIYFIDAIQSCINIDLPEAKYLHTEDARKILLEICDRKDVLVHDETPAPKILDKLFEAFVEPLCDSPTFVLDHPKVMSPLAKAHEDDEGLCERFELFIANKEVCNAYTELNDPIEQRLRFQFENELRRGDGNYEYHALDEDFCTALEHGMPPTAGWGIGIDRLVMILTNTENISNAILFPTMRPDPIGKYRVKKES